MVLHSHMLLMVYFYHWHEKTRCFWLPLQSGIENAVNNFLFAARAKLICSSGFAQQNLYLELVSSPD